jgi:hypothetical protein
MNRSRSREN